MECLRQSLRQLLKKGWIWGSRESGEEQATEMLGGGLRPSTKASLPTEAAAGSRTGRPLQDPHGPASQIVHRLLGAKKPCPGRRGVWG